MTTSELRDYATVAAATIALLVFLFNSRVHRRNQRIENISRFFEVHSRLVEDDGFLMSNLPALEAGTFKRDESNGAAERKFHQLLLQIEQLAILANNRAVPDSTQVYMLGLYAQHILDQLTDSERRSMFWELAVAYLKRLADTTLIYQKMSPEGRKRYQR